MHIPQPYYLPTSTGYALGERLGAATTAFATSQAAEQVPLTHLLGV